MEIGGWTHHISLLTKVDNFVVMCPKNPAWPCSRLFMFIQVTIERGSAGIDQPDRCRLSVDKVTACRDFRFLTPVYIDEQHFNISYPWFTH